MPLRHGGCYARLALLLLAAFVYFFDAYADYFRCLLFIIFAIFVTLLIF